MKKTFSGHLRDAWRSRCAKDGHRVETVTSGEAAKKKMDPALYDVIISDIQDAEHRRAGCLRHRHKSPDSALVLITAVEDYESRRAGSETPGIPLYPQGPGLVDEVKIPV